MNHQALEKKIQTGISVVLQLAGGFFIFVLAYTYPWLKFSLMVLCMLMVIYIMVTRKLLSFSFVILGGAFNFAAAFANNGLMPAVGISDQTHQLLTASTHLKFLCDIYPMYGGTYSIGDALSIFVFPIALIVEYFYHRGEKKVTDDNRKLGQEISGVS